MDNPEKLATLGTQYEGAIKNGQSRETGNIGYRRRRGNQKWTIQRNWHHWVNKTKGQSKMDSPEKLATLGTQDEGAIKNEQSRETGNIGYTRRRGNQKWTIQRNWQHWVHKTKGQSKMDNPEKLAALGTQDEDKQSIKHNTICVGHHYAQANTNNVNEK